MRATAILFALGLTVVLTNGCSGEADGDGEATEGGTGEDEPTDADGDGFPAGMDCNDGDAAIHPDATEVCDGVDNDCDGAVDDEDESVDQSTASSFYADEDGDGHGAEGAEAVKACAEPDGLVRSADDCDDGDAAVHPGATEVCDEADVDEDCNGLADNADPGTDLLAGTTYYPDTDQDSFGDSDAAGTLHCDDPSTPAEAYTTDASDCDDGDGTVNPDADEICADGVDNDCDGSAPECRLSGSTDATSADSVVTSSDADGQYFGFDLTMGDIDGDGSLDLLVSGYAIGNDAGTADAGRTYLKYGPLRGELDLATDADLYADGLQQYDSVGMQLSATGDVNGDGADDILISASHEDLYGSNSGAVYLLYGSTTRGPTGGATVDAVMDAMGGAKLYADKVYSYLGDAVSIVGDVNADGYDDILLGASGYDGSGDAEGGVFLFWGSPSIQGGVVDDLAAAAFLGSESYDFLGDLRSLTRPVDLNADGAHDLVMSARNADSSADVYAGAVYVFMGTTTTTAWSGVYNVSTDADASIFGSTRYDYFGSGVQNAGDVNADGYDDLVVGASGWDDAAGNENVGAAYVFYGGVSGWVRNMDAETAVDAGVHGGAEGDYLGQSVSGGDLDADGHSDLLVGARLADPGGLVSAGASYVVYGPVSGWTSTTSAAASIQGTSSNAYQGYKTAVHDWNSDGMLDAISSGYGDEVVGVMFGGGW